MFEIDGRDQLIIFTDPRSFSSERVKLPLWMIKGYRKVKYKKKRMKMNWFFGLGYVFLIITLLWLVLRMNVQTWLFFIIYGAGATLVIAKRYHDQKLPHHPDCIAGDCNGANDGSDKEMQTYIILETELGEYIVDCRDQCDKLELFLKEYLS